MHGRLKVKTTEQQKAEKKAERLLKMKSYEKAMSRIQELRQGRDSDEEALKLTMGLLHSNPDLSSIWNFRKEIYLAMNDDERKDENVIKTECDLTMRCLEIQPKSYCTWHHRVWVLSQYNKDLCRWDSELALCNKYLTMDERNFHCWDYRRFVLSKRESPSQNATELEFSMDKIKTNFSNYSAWHYRSKLLEKEIASNESLRNDELILTQHAAFTDPEDSSPRFYQKWLLKSSSSCLLSWKYLPKDGILILPRDLKEFDALHEDKPLEKVPYHGHLIWKINPPVVNSDANPRFVFPPSSGILDTDGASNLGDEMKATLEEELKNSLELLELEPDSKWTLSSVLDIMMTLDLRKYYEDILKFLDQLIQLDPFREGYYKDMRSKVKTQYVISSYGEDRSLIDLSGLSLTRIDCPQYLFEAKVINLSNNCLESLSKLHGFLENCQELNISGNPLLRTSDISALCDTTKSLKSITLSGTSEEMKNELPNKYSQVTFHFV